MQTGSGPGEVEPSQAAMSTPSSPSSRPRKPTGRKHSEWFGFFVAWMEERVVTTRAIDLVLPSLLNNWFRPEVEEKLKTLDLSNPVHADLSRRVQLALDLYEAVHKGLYRKPRGWREIEPRLGRALSYFVSNHEAIPDHFADGFDDDHREFVILGEQLGPLMDHFEAWRDSQRRKEQAEQEQAGQAEPAG